MENFVGHPETLWVVHIGRDDRLALRARDEGFVCIGWTLMGDLSPYNTREQMRAAMEHAYPNAPPATITGSYGQAFRFAHEMVPQEFLVFPIRSTREIAIGRIVGGYRFATDDEDLVNNDYCNVRQVEWLKVVPRTDFSTSALHSFGSFSSVSTSNDHLEEVMAVLQGVPVEEQVIRADEEEADEDSAINLYEQAKQETEDYLLKAWQRTGSHFEEVVAAVLEAMGYTATVTQATADHGVDVIAHPDALGLQPPFIKVQVKSGTSGVGEPEVNQLKGTLNAGEKGILISLGRFTTAALGVERTSPSITLINAKRFVALFLDNYDKMDATWRSRYPLKKVFVPLR